MNKNIFLCTLLSIFLTGCFGPRGTNLVLVDTTDINQLENIIVVTPTPSSYSYSSRKRVSPLRAKMLQDSALSIGAQGGLAWSTLQLTRNMKKDYKHLDNIFNFNAMMLSHGVIPPILEEGDFTLNLADPNTIRVSDRTYRIVAQARFATTAPNWRDYLLFSFPKPILPDRTLLPRTRVEQKFWCAAIRIGWEKGIQQGYTIFQQNLARLKRDYRGMIIYRKLLQKNMISQPFVARTEMGVTGDGENMRINDQVLRIVELPKLQTNTNRWKAIVVQHE